MKFAKSVNARQEAKDAALDELADFGVEFSKFMCEWHALRDLFDNSTSEVAALKEAIDWGKEQVNTLNAKLTHSNQPMEEIEQEQLGYLDPVVEQPGHLEPVAEKLTVEDHNNGFKPGGNSKNANYIELCTVRILLSCATKTFPEYVVTGKKKRKEDPILQLRRRYFGCAKLQIADNALSHYTKASKMLPNRIMTTHLKAVISQRVEVKWLQQTVRMAQTIHHH